MVMAPLPSVSQARATLVFRLPALARVCVLLSGTLHSGDALLPASGLALQLVQGTERSRRPACAALQLCCATHQAPNR